MEVLFKSPFIAMASAPEKLQEVSEKEMLNAYNGFVRLIIEISTSVTKEIPAFFRLNYARVELLQIQQEKYTGEIKKIFKQKNI